MAPTISSLTATPTSTDAHQDDKGNKGTITLAVCLALLSVLLLGGIFAFTWRMRQRAKAGLEGFHNLDAHATVVGPRHLASRVTPFGTRDAHQPGRNMRVATRRPDGAWDFTVPATPINPFQGVDEPEPEPAARPRPSKASQASRPKLPKLGSGTGYLDPDGVTLPPPAYSPTDESVLSTRKGP